MTMAKVRRRWLNLFILFCVLSFVVVRLMKEVNSTGLLLTSISVSKDFALPDIHIVSQLSSSGENATQQIGPPNSFDSSTTTDGLGKESSSRAIRQIEQHHNRSVAVVPRTIRNGVKSTRNMKNNTTTVNKTSTIQQTHSQQAHSPPQQLPQERLNDREQLLQKQSNNHNRTFHFVPTITNADWHTPFPRWDSNGIQFDALLQFLDSFVVFKNGSTSLLAPGFDRFASVYVVNEKGLYTSKTVYANINKAHWRSRTLPTQAIMILAHKMLLLQQRSGGDNDDDGDDNNSVREQNSTTTTIHNSDSSDRWRRLTELLVPSSSSNNNNKSMGFPFIGWYGDFTGCNYQNWNGKHSIPLFTTCADLSCRHAFPIPNYKLFEISQETPDQWTKMMQQYSMEFPFEKKISKVVWRGGLTGDLMHYKSPRARIAIYGAEHSKEFLDLRIVTIPDRHKDKVINITLLGGLADKMYMDHFQNYTAILDIDGNSWSSRFPKLLCYNSVIVKVEPRYVDYFLLNDLQPWKQYIPVKYDLSDLEDTAQFIMDPTNEPLIRSIIANANDWCRHRLTRPAIASDLLDVWEAYVRFIDQGSPGWENVWNTKQKEILQSEHYQMEKVELASFLQKTKGSQKL